MKSNRKLYNKPVKLLGVGVNDADYVTQPVIKGVSEVCPFYRKWSNLISRVYDKKVHVKRPNYKDVIVCKEWLSFMNFKRWMEKQDWKGKELDKDILYPNNKIYSPKTCCFVSRELNTAMSFSQKYKGLPTGVFLRKDTGNFRAIIHIDGKNVSLGQYDNPIEAHQVYLTAKISHIKTFYKTVDKRIKKGLKRHVKVLKKY